MIHKDDARGGRDACIGIIAADHVSKGDPLAGAVHGLIGVNREVAIEFRWCRRRKFALRHR